MHRDTRKVVGLQANGAFIGCQLVIIPVIILARPSTRQMERKHLKQPMKGQDTCPYRISTEVLRQSNWRGP